MDQEELEAIKQPTAGFCHATKFIRLNFFFGGWWGWGWGVGRFTLQNLSHAVTFPAASKPYSKSVTMHTTCLHINRNSEFCPCWGPNRFRTVLTINIISLVVFIMENACIYCEL